MRIRAGGSGRRLRVLVDRLWPRGVAPPAVVPGAFPPLAGDPIVAANDPKEQIAVVLHGLHGKAIAGKAYARQMPAFPQLTSAITTSLPAI